MRLEIHLIRNLIHSSAALFLFSLLLIMPVSAKAQIESQKGEIILNSTIDGHITLVPITCSLYRNDNRLSLEGLAEGLRTFTEVTPKIDQNIKLDDKRLLNYPFVYVSTGDKYDEFELLDTEKENLGKYLNSGGFVLIEFGLVAFRGLKNTLPADIRLKPIPFNHQIYKAPFEIDPKSWDKVVSERRGERYTADLPTGPFLTGLFLKDKLVGIYSDKNIGLWNRRINDSSSTSAPVNTNIKFGINLLHYATAMYNEKNR